MDNPQETIIIITFNYIFDANYKQYNLIIILGSSETTRYAPFGLKGEDIVQL